MSILTKWKNALVNRLIASRIRDRHSIKEESHSPEGSQLNESRDKSISNFSRRSVIMAGVYLVLVVLLLSLAVLRWGKIPLPEIPGVKREMGDIFSDIDETGEIRAENEGEITAADQPAENREKSANPSSMAEGWLTLETGHLEGQGSEREPGSEGAQAEKEGEVPEKEGLSAVQARDTYLPQAASPLPEWSLHTPFNAYNSDMLPSGGVLHSFSRGVHFRATPGAPVSALWDGYVVKTGGKDSPYSNSVLIKHDGGFSSYYGNLWEVWVEEGRFVNRGENIGLMPHNPPRDTLAVSTSNVDRENCAGVVDQKSNAKENCEPQQVPIRTILSGYRGGDIVESWGGELQYNNEKQTDTTDNMASTASTPLFYEESPLLYVEVRFSNNSFLDPLEFIPARN
jgi:murein DD-endopeptidase MepM/ murein hydrolase activator NlpD